MNQPLVAGFVIFFIVGILMICWGEWDGINPIGYARLGIVLTVIALILGYMSL